MLTRTAPSTSNYARDTIASPKSSHNWDAAPPEAKKRITALI